MEGEDGVRVLEKGEREQEKHNKEERGRMRKWKGSGVKNGNELNIAWSMEGDGEMENERKKEKMDDQGGSRMDGGGVGGGGG